VAGSDLVDPKSLFDQRHPPEQDLLDRCVHCGFCLPACPTYQLWREEMDSPRGRIYLMQMALGGNAESLDTSMVQHFDRCLGCMACMTACPSGVEYGKLIGATRAQVERNYRRRFWDRLYRALIFAIFPHPGRLRAISAFIWLYERLGIRWLMKRSGLTMLLPSRLQQMESLLPPVTWRGITSQLPTLIPAAGRARKRIGLVLGCVQRIYFDHVNAATARVLAAEGCDVFVPPEQGCCGALMTHTGREEEALAAARRLIDCFEPLDLDYIVINAAGCGSNVKEYGHLLRDDPAYAKRAALFSAKCRDISEALAELEPQAPRNPVPIKVAYQDSCHLFHAQKVAKQPRDVLKSIPGLELLELPDTGCCGSAGVYNLIEPATAHELGERKARTIVETGAQALVSGNPGCLLQLTKELRLLGCELPSFHLVELLDSSIRGSAPFKHH
jgi:glycolate oxidase iron-sulfur subunit